MKSSHVLLTGVTGFVGKVVLEELLRRRRALGISGVTVLVRPSKTRDGKTVEPATRFESSVATAGVFSALDEGWTRLVDVVACDLEKPRCGLSEVDWARVTRRTTHVIHCAASVEFDLPVREAAAANVTTALEVLELARACTRLVGMVDVSTAYVTAWRQGPIHERLAHLPRPATELLADILDDRRPESEMLAETGHPNTYTFTKCITEHLISERRGDVPVVIVRPSIVSASWKAPFPGWLDSPAALAGCLLYMGMGVVRALHADPATRLDVVPVDLVSQRIVETAFGHRWPRPGEAIPIRFAAMGIEHALRIDMTTHANQKFFRERPGAKSTPKTALFRGDDFERGDLVGRELPIQLMRGLLAATGRKRDKRRLERADEKVRYLNEAFRYFTHHTFDFRLAEPLALADFDPPQYVDIVNRSLYTHLLGNDETQISIAGAAHDDALDDVSWARRPADGNVAIRTLGLAVRKAMRRCASNITFDRPSFERAVANAPADTLFVLAPSHRSYLDFLLTSYLCFQHPELGIAVPHIAAAEEFKKLPLVGRVLQQSRAFYIKRGVGKEAPELTEALQHLVAEQASLMFFVEGQRSRSRHFLPPKRGLLRGLQKTRRTFTVLPVSISYDRLPEEPAFDRELTGGARSKMSLPALLRWVGDLMRNRVQLGRMHLACGEPLVLDGQTDVPGLARRVVAEQQRQTVVSSFHLRAFLEEPNNRSLAALGVDEAWLKGAVERRGGRVLDSDLAVPRPITGTLAQSLRNQWAHWFFGDALALYPDNAAVQDHVARNAWLTPPRAADLSDVRVRAVVAALLGPVIRDYRLAATRLGDPASGLSFTTPKAMLSVLPQSHLPHLEDAFAVFVESGILEARAEGDHAWGPRAERLAEFTALDATPDYLGTPPDTTPELPLPGEVRSRPSRSVSPQRIS
jgi:nucleoside-diphosphate-sugar epimerase/1-acyl-sn-glycerol-3-phosphate acyltransferase